MRNEIWSKEFSTEIEVGGIYRIYFQGWEQHSYIGITNRDSWSFKWEISSLKFHLWKFFSGIDSNNYLSKNHLLNQQEYAYLSLSAKESYDLKLKRCRNEMLEKINQGEVSSSHWEYWKMIYFLETNRLNLSDLCFEVLHSSPITETREQTETIFFQLVEKYDAYVQGFNDELLVELVMGEFGEQKSADWLIRMKELVLKKQVDSYTQWNCWWHLAQTLSSLVRDEPLMWAQFWKQVSLIEISNDLARVERAIINADKNAKVPNIDHLSFDLKSRLVNFPNPNVRILLNNHRRNSFERLVRIDDWVLNNQKFWLFVNEMNTDFHTQILKFYGSQTQIEEFFALNPFEDTKMLKTKIEGLNQNFLKKCQRLKEPQLYIDNYFQRLKSGQEQRKAAEFLIDDLFAQYFYHLNFFNRLIFNRLVPFS